MVAFRGPRSGPSKFAGGFSKTHPNGGRRSGGLGVRSFGKSAPFTGNTRSRLAGRTPGFLR